MIIQHQNTLYINKDKLIQRHRNGICLVKPCASSINTQMPLSHLFDSQIATYFMDLDSCAVLANRTCASLNSALSEHDLISKNATHFYKKETALRHIADDQVVLKTKSLVATGGTSEKIDDTLIDVITFKIPWYEKNKVLGVLGLTFTIDNNKLYELSQNIAVLLATQLFSPQQFSQISPINSNDHFKVYFSQREMDILLHLIRGRTAREISEILVISQRTVENHIARMKDKSGCASKSELIDKYFHLGY